MGRTTAPVPNEHLNVQLNGNNLKSAICKENGYYNKEQVCRMIGGLDIYGVFSNVQLNLKHFLCMSVYLWK